MARNWRKIACLFHLAPIKILLWRFSWVPQSAKLADFEEERRAAGGLIWFLFCHWIIYRFSHSLQRLLLVSRCLVRRWGRSPGWGCRAGRLRRGLLGLLPLLPLLPEPPRGRGSCPGLLQSTRAVLLCARARRKHGRSCDLESFAGSTD